MATVTRLLALVLAAALAVGLVGFEPAGAIVDGTATRVQRHPWMVSLQDGEGHVCGGSIVGATTVVTAAHCTEDYFADELTVLAGVTRFRDPGLRRNVVEILEHPSYFEQDGFDIAVLHVDRSFEWSRAVRPIRLARPIEMARADSAVVTGWGALSETDERGSSRLRQARLPLVDDPTCESLMAVEGEWIAPRSELCAGATGADSCYGDSGGPLVIRNARGKPRLAGVVSWGVECGGASPGVYAEMAHFRRWVLDNR